MQPFWKRILSIDLVDLRLFFPAKYSNSICQIFFKTKDINVNHNEIVYMAISQGKWFETLTNSYNNKMP